MSNRWVFVAPKFCGLSITHRWHRLVIDVIDYSSMTHRSLIGYYTAHDRHYSCFLVPMICFRLWFFYLCWTHFSLYLKFLLTMSRRKVLITNTDDSQLCSISLYLTLYLITKQLNIKITNQSENETNRYADKNRPSGYWDFLWLFVSKNKTASA